MFGGSQALLGRMEPNIFKYIWQYSRGEQIRILLVVMVSLPFYFVALDLPKSIVNEGIQGSGFFGPGSEQPFLAIDLPFGEMLTDEPVPLFDGFMMDQPTLLIAFSLAFLLMVTPASRTSTWPRSCAASTTARSPW